MEISLEKLNKIIDMYFADLETEVLKIVPKKQQNSNR